MNNHNKPTGGKNTGAVIHTKSRKATQTEPGTLIKKILSAQHNKRSTNTQVGEQVTDMSPVGQSKKKQKKKRSKW